MARRETMQAWEVAHPGDLRSGPLQRVERKAPRAGPGQVRITVLACGVCRTDLHVVEGDLPPHHKNVVPGHEIVGVVDEVGPACSSLHEGDRVGVPWLASTCGTCRFCRAGRENLCLEPAFTGWDRDG